LEPAADEKEANFVWSLSTESSEFRALQRLGEKSVDVCSLYRAYPNDSTLTLVYKTKRAQLNCATIGCN